MVRTKDDARALGRFVYQKRVARFLKLRLQALASANAEAAAARAAAKAAAAAAAAAKAAAAAAAAEAATVAAARESAAQAAAVTAAAAGVTAAAAGVAAEGDGGQAGAAGRCLLRSTTDVAASIDGFADMFAGEEWAAAAAEDAGTGEEAAGSGACDGSTPIPEASEPPAAPAAARLLSRSSSGGAAAAMSPVAADQPPKKQGFGQEELAAFLEARGAGACRAAMRAPAHLLLIAAAHVLQKPPPPAAIPAAPPSVNLALETCFCGCWAPPAALCLQGTRLHTPFRCWIGTARSGSPRRCAAAATGTGTEQIYTLHVATRGCCCSEPAARIPSGLLLHSATNLHASSCHSLHAVHACALPSALLLLQNVVRMVRQIHKDRTNLRRGLRGTNNILKVRPSLPCARCPL